MRRRVPRLPDTYQEVDYIQSSGTQYIDTWVSANQYLSYEAKLTALWTTNDSPLFGARTGSTSNRFWLIVYGWNFHMMIGSTSAESFNNTPVDANSHTCSVFINNWSYTATIDWNTSTGSTSTAAYVNQNFWLFKYNYWSVAPCPMKLYYFKLYTGSSTLVRDFVPCYRKSDSVVWMYDLVNNQFYTNAWSGTFTKGTDSSTLVYKEFQVWPEKEEVVFDYDFTTTNPWSDLIWNGDSYGFTRISGSWLRTQNVSYDDRRWRAAKQIWEDITTKTIVMDGTWYAQFWETRTWFGMWLRTWPATTSSNNTNGIFVHLGTTYYSSYTTYDWLNCPWISSGTWKWVSAFWRTIWTSWSYTVRFLWELNLKSGKSHLEIYRNWTLFSTQDYTLSAADLTLARWYAASNCYYTAAFERGYRNVTMYMKSWKVTIKW